MKKAFSLLELSVSIIIIGLLVTVITYGQDLINGAKIRRVIGEFNELNRAIFDFKAKYGNLPGDLADASDYWGNDCNGAGSTDFCSGNGDGEIDRTSGEAVLATYHLQKARFIADNLVNPITSVDNNASFTANEKAYLNVEGSIIPKSSWPNAGFSIWGDNSQSIPTNAAIWMGASVSNAWNSTPIMLPTDAYAIDRKIDDGVPNAGKYYGYSTPLGHSYTSSSNCISSNKYNLTYTSANACGGVYVIDVP